MLPRAGLLLRDPGFFDLLIEADLPFAVLDAPELNRSTLPGIGLRAFRSDPRRFR